ncbi:hypothetical protein BDR05DRAFT_106190 [Suillus weaverae]|nr:hypothetical protein BDR05DRAFT_106190 [Suillus weaverae]
MQLAGHSTSRNRKTSAILPSSSLLSFLLIGRFILSHQSPKSPLPSTIPGNPIVIYVVVCSCPWSSTQVTLFLDHPILIFIHLPIYTTKLT